MDSPPPVAPLEYLRRQLERFAPLPNDEWELLPPHLEERTLPKGALFVEAGKRAPWVAFVLAGTFRQYYTVDGVERSTYFYLEGDLLCDYLGCLRGRPAGLSIEVLEAAQVLCFPYEVIDTLYRQRPAWGTLGRKLAEYLAAGLEERMVSLLTERPEARYAALLAGNKTRILERIPQQYIASYLGITPVSLSRIRGRRGA
ncbi:Crp/Fnr family transcriptional regulator [Flaviaesturariibacter amylovorans]|uniref:Crp/Fnr family transcriptional regulator n=1 Tax=Flaviaesturariibacter amylovorans TaxID=1084520 RepID=A0ABP8HFH0_9BACT